MTLAKDIEALNGRKFDQPIADSLFPVYAEFGIDRHSHGKDSQEQRLEAMRAWVTAASDTPRSGGVFMDNMSLYSAFKLITGKRDHVPANVLLDLDTFVRCAVLYDHIFHLDGTAGNSAKIAKFDSRVLNELLGNERVVIPIPVDLESYEHGVSGALSDLFDQVEVDVSKMAAAPPSTAAAADYEAIRRAWEIVLGRPIEISDLDDVISRSGYWISWGPALVQNLLRVVPDHDAVFAGLEKPNTFISEANARSLFNTRVAGILGLPYAPNTTRIPFRAHLLANAAVAQDALQDVQEIQAIFDEFAAGFFARSLWKCRSSSPLRWRGRRCWTVSLIRSQDCACRPPPTGHIAGSCSTPSRPAIPGLSTSSGSRSGMMHTSLVVRWLEVLPRLFWGRWRRSVTVLRRGS